MTLDRSAGVSGSISLSRTSSAASYGSALSVAASFCGAYRCRQMSEGKAVINRPSNACGRLALTGALLEFDQ